MGRVKDQLIDQQDQEYQESLEPDFDDYALAMRAKDKDDQHEWEKVNDEGKFCKNCQHCERTRDAYGTGDSPCIRECTAKDPSECPGLML